MKRAFAWLAITFALALLGIGGLVGAAIHDQVRRDDACSASVQQHVAEIERFRRKTGRLPQLHELRGGGMSLELLRPRPGGEDYDLTFWRGEWSVHYDSATKQDTCDDGARQGQAWLAGLLLPISIGLLWWGARLLRRSGPRRA